MHPIAVISLVLLLPSIAALNDDVFMNNFQSEYHRNFTTSVHPELDNHYEEAQNHVGWEQWVPSNITLVLLVSALLLLLNIIIILLCWIHNLFKKLQLEQEDMSIEMQTPVIQVTGRSLHHLNIV